MTAFDAKTKASLLAELAEFNEVDLEMALRAAKSSKQARGNELGSYFLANFLGERRTVEGGQATLTLGVQDWMMNPGDILHGGVTAFLCDNTLGMASFLQQQRPGVTVDLNVRYHLPVTKGIITGRGEVVSAGSRINSARGEVYDDSGRLVATATGTFYHPKR